MQREACWTRRGAGGSEFLKGNGYLAAAYVHRSSRNGDPQLHTHVLVANTTKADGRWTRLYRPAIYDHATTASYIYEVHLRDELSRRLGAEWQPKGIAEIEGFAGSSWFSDGDAVFALKEAFVGNFAEHDRDYKQR